MHIRLGDTLLPKVYLPPLQRHDRDTKMEKHPKLETTPHKKSGTRSLLFCGPYHGQARRPATAMIEDNKEHENLS
jgi:hypothetical protein